MRKFLKRIRKGIKTACLSAVLATCWQAGQVAQAAPEWGQEVTVQLSGIVSPTSNVSHLYLFYGTGYSGIYMSERMNIGDFPAGQNTAFQEEVSVEYYQTTGFCAVGLYGDISSGTYIAGTNGVTLGLEAADEGDPFNWHCYGSMDYTEEEVFNFVLADDMEKINELHINPLLIIYHDYEDTDYIDSSGTLNLYNFSGASAGGQMDVQATLVPEPVTAVLFGTGLTIFAAGRRRKN